MKIKYCLMCIYIIVISCLAGCQNNTETWQAVHEKTITIAIVGEGDFIKDGGTMEAAELAAEDFKEKTGIEIKIAVYDDGGDYYQAISYAKEIAANKKIAAVIVKQELDFIDSIAEIYEEAQKPFIITNGCYNHTIEDGYEYLIADFINAKDAGSIMAEYIVESGYSKVAFCHSDTEYEEDELKGLQTGLNGTGIYLADTVVGPYTQEQFDVAYERWELLGIDVVCVSNYYICNSDVVRMLREKGSDIQVISDYVMDTSDDINKNGKYLDGTVIIPLYSTTKMDVDNEVAKRYKEKYNSELLEREVQIYDLITMLGNTFISDIKSSKDAMDILKAEEGYDGVYEKVHFDERGALMPGKSGVLIFENGAFRVK